MIWRFLFSSATWISSSHRDAGLLRAQALLVTAPSSLSASSRALMPAISRFCFCSASASWRLHLEDRLRRLDVLLGDRLLALAVDLVREDLLRGGQLGDLLDALGVEDVVRVEQRDRRLLEVIDRHVLEHEAVQVRADALQDAFLELVARVVEIHEVELPADGLERLGELRVEQLDDRAADSRRVRSRRIARPSARPRASC